MCDCIEKVNVELAKENTKLTLPMVMNIKAATMRSSVKTMVETERLTAKRGSKVWRIFATYCPFCGKKYETP